MRSSRYASLTRLVIGASILTGLIGSTASVALAANAPVTFGVLREEDAHNGVHTTDLTFLDTDTVTGTGDTATGLTVTLSSSSPSQDASVEIIAPTGGALVNGDWTGITAAPQAAKPGLVVTVDGNVCVSGPSNLKINQMGFSGTDVSILHVYFELAACPAAGFAGELHGLIAINSTATLSALASSPINTLAFGNVTIGDTSVAKTITFTNIGNTAMSMSSLALAGRYPEEYLYSENCTTLAAGASCTATVTYRPTKFDLREAAVTVTGDDSLSDLKKEVLITGTGLLVPDGPNDTPAHAIDISTLPAYSGVQINTIDPSTSPCSTVADDRAGWWHFKSTTGSKTVALSTTQSDVGTSIALYSGSAASPTFIKCGANADVALHDSLSFVAANNVDYYIRIQRETPGDYAIVLKAVLGAPDTTVEVTGFMTNYGTIYPVVDGYRDSIDIRATRNEQASASIAIYNPAGSKIRTLTVPSGIGQYSVAWNGRNTAGTIQPAGKYKIISTVTDTSGNKLSDTRFVTVSSKKLVTKTYTQTLDAAKYTKLLTTGRATTSKTSTAYAGGLKMTSSSNGTIAAIYSFSAPAAYSYTSVTFTVIGKGATNTMTLGLQDWTTCTTYDTACVGAIHPGPHSSGTASAAVTAPATNTIYSTVHRIRGYLFAPTMVGVTRTLDARDVKITVTYKALG